MKRRVVVTGLGLVTPLGSGVSYVWKNLLEGRSGVKSVKSFDVSDISCQIAATVPSIADAPSDWLHPKSLFDASSYVDSKEQRRMDPFIIYGIAASQQAIEDSGLSSLKEETLERAGVMIGSGIGGLSFISDTAQVLIEKGVRRVTPFFIPASLINLVSGHVSIRHGFKGPNHSVVNACATGANAIGDAARIIAYDDADIMIAGGAEAAVCRLGLAGFAACRSLSTGFNHVPEKASRPWDRSRDGFVMGEGAGIVVLEEFEHAKKRGAKIYAELVGYGLSGDANHITAPCSDGDGAARAIRMALKNANVDPASIDYINAHGTSTPPGDLAEVRAVKTVFGDHAYRLAISSTKSSIGHLLGASGSVEAIFSILALNDQVCPPTLNLDEPDTECDLNFVPHAAQERKIDHVVSNSFGFGGTNASLVFSRG